MFKDKHGNEIKVGMTLRHDDGEVEKVIQGETTIGFDAMNPDYAGYNPLNEYIYPLKEFNLNEWEIVDNG